MSSCDGRVEPGIDRPHPARVADYWLGGRDYYPADRAAAEAVESIAPGVAASVRAYRAFLGRCVRHLILERGVRQFLDIGSGLPTGGNTHQVAQRLAPESRVVYADNDPLVVAHARSLLTSTPQGAVSYLEGDLRRPEHILKHAAETLDLTRPVALMLLGVLGHIPDETEAGWIVRYLVESVPSGSYLVIVHPTLDTRGETMSKAILRFRQCGGTRVVARDRARLIRFFDGLELLEPGVVTTSDWRPDTRGDGLLPVASELCGVGRKP
ncbi:SAM-dependent methyltransferase [Thermomonospora sp. CIF 1]|nr:SAM-dependent methyltransferase [Thermomonospora sp. CIF 1]